MAAHYRIAIFGSARVKEGDGIYQEVYGISRALAEIDFDIVTGGGPGLMQAANSGHRSAAAGSHSIGLNIKLPFTRKVTNIWISTGNSTGSATGSMPSCPSPMRWSWPRAASAPCSNCSTPGN